MQFCQRFSRLTPNSLLERLFPLPEHRSYTIPSKLSLILADTLEVSSRISGRLLSISDFASRATSVVLKSPMYRDSPGFAQTEAPNISVTVLPPSVSPQRSTKNGRAPTSLIRILAKLAANIIFGSILPVARTFFTCSYHSVLLPPTLILSYNCRNLISPSNTISLS